MCIVRSDGRVSAEELRNILKFSRLRGCLQNKRLQWKSVEPWLNTGPNLENWGSIQY